MKLSALTLLVFLPVAIAAVKVGLKTTIQIKRDSIENATMEDIDSGFYKVEQQVKPDFVEIENEANEEDGGRRILGEDRIDTELVKVKGVFAPELSTSTDQGHRALWCGYMCDGSPPGYPCYVSCLSGLRHQLC